MQRPGMEGKGNRGWRVLSYPGSVFGFLNSKSSGIIIRQRRMRQPLSMSIYTQDHALSCSPLYKERRCAHDATCSNVMRTGGLDAPFLFISFILFYLFIFYLMIFAWIRMRLPKKETGCVCASGVEEYVYVATPRSPRNRALLTLIKSLLFSLTSKNISHKRVYSF